jgi:osmotically-inducible protein OsmY
MEVDTHFWIIAGAIGINLSVNADAVRNEVTLSGTVRTHTARKRAIELAKSAKPGVLVNDKIDVKPAG